ncbi:MAG: hypothetical protein ACRC4W_00005, partial [Treponemataceae bacterium]
MSKNLVMLINAHQPYIKNMTNEFITENSLLFSAISHTYLPLLRMLNRLKTEDVPFKIALVLSPTLCELLNDPVVQAQYIEWTEKFIIFAHSELERTKDDPKIHALAQLYHNEIEQNLFDFTEKYNQNILAQFSSLANEGFIELLASAATQCFFPLYQDLPETIDAQIEVGLMSHKYFFGDLPCGFWLPHMGYCNGLEKNLRSYGFDYSITNTHSFLFANPFLKNGIFSPVKAKNNFIFFANSIDSCDSVFSQERGLFQNETYCNHYQDIAFEQESAYINNLLGTDKARFSSGFCYNAKKSSQTAYNVEKATVQAQNDAKHFVTKIEKKLLEAQKLLPSENDFTCVCCFDASFFGIQWKEGISWLESVIRFVQKNETLELKTPETIIKSATNLQKATLYPSSSLGDGYSEDFLDASNSQMFSSAWKESARLIDLVKRFDKMFGVGERALNFASKQLLLAQASDWQ